MASKRLHTQMAAAAEGVGHTLRSRYGIWGLALISFVESALPVPLITDPFLIAYILANKRDVLRGIVVTTIASVLGGVVAYFIAVGFFEVVMAPYVSETAQEEIHSVASEFEEGVFILSLTGAVTPFPYTFVAVAAGIVEANLLLFVIASLLGRGFRYGVEGWLVHRFGEPALRIVKKQILATTILCIVMIVLYILYKF